MLEKLHYMHEHPVKEKLVRHPGDWPWSTWCFYYGREALLKMDPWSAPSLGASIKTKQREERPTLCEKQKRKG
jgi:hypothetical protein